MRAAFPFVASLALLAGCQSQSNPVYLHTYSGGNLAFPDDFPNDRPSIIAFLDIDDRKNDGEVKSLRGFSARPEVNLVGVMTYSDNSFVENFSGKDDLTFPVMLDPKKKMANRFAVRRYPTYVYLDVAGREIGREYDSTKIKGWYKSTWLDKGHARRPSRRPIEEDE